MTIKIIYGGASLNPGYYPTDEGVQELLAVLKEEGVTTIDTARLYAGSEETIGRNTTDFIIDTKIPGGFGPGSAKRENLIAGADDSLEKLKIKQLDVFYIHAPPVDVPFEEVLDAVNEVYKKGLFKRFGVSNFTAEQVQEFYDISKSKGYILPSVYQGNYSAIARKTETELFPTLRKLGFSFYAYSPIAGGFLVKTLEQLDEGSGKFNDNAVGGLYNKLYNRPIFRDALADWNAIAKKEGVSNAELAYRWIAHHSLLKEELGDAVIFGASRVQQARETTKALKKGPLSSEAAEAINAIWPKLEKEAILDNWTVVSGGK
ncbi:Aldo/keto reductase [Aaosphaeria arxii CBS 175.79]|uniref:Aldo/keto reductase n=1 Tax=Aaosphaeria arxii CBS 175.79 TaxID=1450172 RepID=A0A6A5Y7Z4_9PLEO|nr:Aldo/keto reductase [Aaosphaeria arxii CBS 175.79]KAF2021137.1 Aldo/keto reductase [Aaosphaeria arxii CBS 175.79]